MKIRLSKPALRDLDAIYRQGVQQFGVQQAQTYQQTLKQAFRSIAEFPEANRVRSEFQKPYRIHRHEAHLIFYRVEHGEVCIARIRHGYDDWTSDG